MNRSPRRPARIQPPLRGRSAAVPSPGNDQPLLTIVRQRPPISSGRTTIVTVVENPACDDLHPDWMALYEKFPGLLKVLNRPWKWLVVLVGLVSLSMLLGNQL